RWGAEILVANQAENGNWDKGGYHGAKPTLDTCLALLFLKRANLARDLTNKIPFRAADLIQAVANRLPGDPASAEEKAANAPGLLKNDPQTDLASDDPGASEKSNQEKPGTNV